MSTDQFNSCVVIGIAALFFMLGVFAGGYSNAKITKEDAIKAGAAEYQVNPTNGAVTFVWKKFGRSSMGTRNQ